MANISQEVNIEMLEKLGDGSYKKKHPETKASQVKLEDITGNFVATELEGAMGELFTNVSNGKDLVGGAITGVDDSVVIPTDPTFGDLASAIGGISTGKKWASGIGEAPSSVLDVHGLSFRPSLVISMTMAYIQNTSYAIGYSIMGAEFNPFRAAAITGASTTRHTSIGAVINEYTIGFREDGFSLHVAHNTSQKWIAFE